MSHDQLRRDVTFLSGQLPHRGAHTDHERMAAEYLRDRFSEYTALSDIDDFHSIESQNLLFASYYAEFIVVAIAASFFPWISFAYGMAVFVLYMTEFTGYRMLSRLMPQFDSQNVVARFMGTRPERLIVVTANYDSPRALNLKDPAWLQFSRPLHLGLVWCMLLVVLSCATQAMHVFPAELHVDLYVRWVAVGLLVLGAVRLYTLEQRSEFARGPIDNASGTVVLLALAERLRRAGLERSDVWLVATGSKSSWMAGMRRLLESDEVDKRHTYILNVAHVGAGELRYVTREGLLYAFPCDAEMVRAAHAESVAAGADSTEYRWPPSDAFLALARGYRAMSVVGTDEDDLPIHWTLSDTRAQIDYGDLARAADYVESIVRHLDGSMSSRS